jgi:hypothetical protein
MTYGDTEFYEVFLDKKDAILVAHDINESRKDMIFHNPKSRKCEVKSLADAIDWIKESIEDERDFNDYISNV